MSKVELNLPEAKFKVGQVIKRTHPLYKKPIYVSIFAVSANGEWRVSNGKQFIQLITATYEFVYQPGSFTRSKIQHPIRPGSFGIMYQDEFEAEEAEVVPWSQSLWTPDTEENCYLRMKNWEAKHNQKN